MQEVNETEEATNSDQMKYRNIEIEAGKRRGKQSRRKNHQIRRATKAEELDALRTRWNAQARGAK